MSGLACAPLLLPPTPCPRHSQCHSRCLSNTRLSLQDAPFGSLMPWAPSGTEPSAGRPACHSLFPLMPQNRLLCFMSTPPLGSLPGLLRPSEPQPWILINPGVPLLSPSFKHDGMTCASSSRTRQVLALVSAAIRQRSPWGAPAGGEEELRRTPPCNKQDFLLLAPDEVWQCGVAAAAASRPGQPLGTSSRSQVAAAAPGARPPCQGRCLPLVFCFRY